MDIRKFKLLFILFLFSFAVSAAKMSPKSVRRSLKQEKKNLQSITKAIESIEKKLERSNQEVLKMTSGKSSLERDIFVLKKTLLTSLANLNLGKKEIRHLLTSIAVNTFEEDEGPASLLSRKILVRELKTKLKNYNEQIRITKKRQVRLNDIEREIKLFETKERMLLETIANLEESKRLQAQSYVETKKRYQSSLQKWQKIKVAKTKKKGSKKLRSQLGVFQPPLEKHTSMDFRKKGVTFLFNESQPVRAARSGKIVHIGSLSAYGNVVMLDHGNETFSVCLGDFKPRLKKGASVNKGQVLGYTPNKNGKLYFEVRRGDKAQPTIHLLDEGALAMSEKKKK